MELVLKVSFSFELWIFINISTYKGSLTNFAPMDVVAGRMYRRSCWRKPRQIPRMVITGYHQIVHYLVGFWICIVESEDES